MPERLWKIFGGLLLISVFILMFGIITAAAIGFISVSPLLILGIILIIVLVGVGAIREPESIQRSISRNIGRLFSNPSNDSQNRTARSHRSTETGPTGFDRIVEVADEESTELGDHLRRIRAESGEVTTEDLVHTLAAGIRAQNVSPMQQVLQSLRTLLNSRDFVENSDDLTLRVIQREEDVIYARLTEDHGVPQVGIEFEVYIDEAIHNEGEVETYPKHVGNAKVILVEEEFCGLKITSWTDHFNIDEDNRMRYIMDQNPRIQFNEDAVSGVEWDDLEQAYESLRELMDGE